MFLTTLKDTKRSYLVIYYGKCNYICTYINLVSNSVVLVILQTLLLHHHFQNHNLQHEITYSLRFSPPPPPQVKNSGCAPGIGSHFTAFE